MDIDTLLAAALIGCGLYLAAVVAHGIRVIRYARSPQRRLDERLSQLRR
jgi:small basic protein